MLGYKHAVLGSCKKFTFTMFTRDMIVPNVRGHGTSSVSMNVLTLREAKKRVRSKCRQRA